MKIQQIQNNNTNFQGLQMDRASRKFIGSYIDRFPGVKECADKFDVVIKSKVDAPILRHLTFAIPGLLGAIFGAMVGRAFDYPIIGTVLGEALGYATTKKYLDDYDFYDFELQVGKDITKNCFGKDKLKVPLSRKYEINSLRFEDTDIAKVANDNDRRQFIGIISKYNINNIFEPKKLLNILNDDAIKRYFKNGSCFNYKLENNNSNDTLLAKFLDIVPTEENEKDYQKIIKFMRKAKYIDYKQVDSNGISAIEKIINSENPDLLDLVKSTEFDYSRELDYAYERIDDKNFKEKVKSLNINFPNVKEAIRLNSTEALQKLLPEFKSPFFNTKKLVNDLSGKVSINNLNNAITFLEDNGIDTAGVII